jgi:hypothetical protein
MYLTCTDPKTKETYHSHDSWMSTENREAMKAIVNKHE